METLRISDITPKLLQHQKIRPRIIEASRIIRLEKSSTDGYIIILMGYARSPFRGFTSYLKSFDGLDEDDVQLILKE